MRRNSFSSRRGMLLLFVFFIKGQHCFFIRHRQGLCLSTNGEEKLLIFKENCALDTNSQFQFDKNGSIVQLSSRGCIVKLQNGSVAISGQDNCDRENAIEHTRKYSLRNVFANTCIRPKQHVPEVNGEIEYSKECDKDEQQFFFGSIGQERRSVSVMCHPNQSIGIEQAIYGKERNIKNCTESDSDCEACPTCVVKGLCEGKTNCDIPVSTRFLSDPCWGVRKYIYIEYYCVDNTAPFNSDKYLFVNYVRLTSSVFPNEGFLEITTNNITSNVCANSFSSKAQKVLCNQFGYQGVKQSQSSSLLYTNTLTKTFSGNITCPGHHETRIPMCCINNSTDVEDCSSLAVVSCLICSETLLEDQKKFPDTVFSASGSLANHGAEKARISSNNSWCAPANNVHYLDIDLGRIYVIANVFTFGAIETIDWVVKFNLNYSLDKVEWKTINGKRGDYFYDPISRLDTPNRKPTSNYAANLKLNTTAQFLRFIPLTSVGRPCLKVELCGHTLLPDPLRSLTITKITWSTVSISWLPPLNQGHQPLSRFRIRVFRIKSIVQNVTESGEKRKSVVGGLLPYTNYELSVAAGNLYGFSEETTAYFKTAEAAPSGPPRNVQVIAQSSSSLYVSWEDPDEDKRNGIIRNYIVCVSHFNNGVCFKEYVAIDKNYIVRNLNVSTRYFVNVLASTKGGSGVFSSSKEHFTNGDSPSFLNGTSNTLSFTLEIPNENFTYMEIVALKLMDGQQPIIVPDRYDETNLLSYADLNKFSQPKPYIAAVFSKSNTLQRRNVVLGDRSKFILWPRSHRGSINEYFNGPLDSGTSYSIFQRFYIDQNNYYSTEWSLPAQTMKLNSTTTTPTNSTSGTKDSSEGSSKTPLHIVIAILVVLIAGLIVVIIYLCVGRSRRRSFANDKNGTQIDNNTGQYEDVVHVVQIPLPVIHAEDNPNVYEELDENKRDDENKYQALEK